MNLKEIYHETSDRETAESAEGHAQNDIQVGQVCNKFMEVVKEWTNGEIDIRQKLKEYGVEVEVEVE